MKKPRFPCPIQTPKIRFSPPSLEPKLMWSKICVPRTSVCMNVSLLSHAKQAQINHRIVTNIYLYILYIFVAVLILLGALLASQTDATQLKVWPVYHMYRFEYVCVFFTSIQTNVHAPITHAFQSAQPKQDDGERQRNLYQRAALAAKQQIGYVRVNMFAQPNARTLKHIYFCRVFNIFAIYYSEKVIPILFN